MTKIYISLADLDNEDVLDTIEGEATYMSSRTIKNESLRLRDKEYQHGNKSKARKSRREVE